MKAPTIKAALLVGFGLTLGLWLFVGYQVTRGLAQAQRDASDVNVRYMQAQELLAGVRAQVLLASIYLRDALLGPDADPAHSNGAQLAATYRSIDTALERYVPILDSSAERQRVERLRREIAEYRTEALVVLGTESSRWPVEARTMLRRLMPKRETVIRVSEEVQALNRVAFVQQQTALAEMHAATQRRVWAGLGAALALSLAIGLLASMYAGRLETRLKRQREKEEQNTADLQRLSARLIRAQEEERRRIARELHDEIGQVLSAIKVELTLAQRKIDSGGASMGLLDSSQIITDAALHAVRDLSRLLHPAVLDDLGLAAALDSFTGEFARRHQIRVELVHEGLEERMSADVERAAYRIVQEALTNVARHARARSCHIQVERRRSAVALAIADDGTGFDPDAVTHDGALRGLGLVSMRERASQLGGTFVVESEAGVGTRILVELPVDRRSESDNAPAFDELSSTPVMSAAGVLRG